MTIGHSKHSLPTTLEVILHMDITRSSVPKSDWLYSLQSKLKKLFPVSSQQKQDLELTVAQIISSLLQNSGLNQRKVEKTTRPFRYQFSSVIQSCPTLCDPMDCSTPGFPVHHQLLELTQTHVHWVDDGIQPSHLLLSLSPPTFNLSQHQGLFRELALQIGKPHGLWPAKLLCPWGFSRHEYWSGLPCPPPGV